MTIVKVAESANKRKPTLLIGHPSIPQPGEQKGSTVPKLQMELDLEHVKWDPITSLIAATGRPKHMIPQNALGSGDKAKPLMLHSSLKSEDKGKHKLLHAYLPEEQRQRYPTS